MALLNQVRGAEGASPLILNVEGSHLCTYAFTIITCLLVLSLCVFLCRLFLRRWSEVEDEERKRRNVVKKWLQVNRKRAAKKINKRRHKGRRAKRKALVKLHSRWCTFITFVVFLLLVCGWSWMFGSVGCREQLAEKVLPLMLLQPQRSNDGLSRMRLLAGLPSCSEGLLSVRVAMTISVCVDCEAANLEKKVKVDNLLLKFFHLRGINGEDEADV
jgi:hypothetical protein